MHPRSTAAFVLMACVATLAPIPAPASKTVAVLHFDNNTGEDRYNNLGRALAAMMISDLSVVEEIQLVERERLEDIVEELDFQQTAYVDSSTAQTVGMIAGAEFVVAGAFATVEPDMRLDTRVVSVESSEIVKAATVTGKSDELFDLQVRLADELIDGLAIALSPEARERLRAQQEANRIDDVQTALAFSQALCYLDAGAYVLALERMERVRDGAPSSRIVELALEDLRERVEEDAKSRLKDEASNAVRGLMGRRRSARRSDPLPLC